MERQTDKQTDGQMGWRTDRWVDRWTDGQMGRWTAILCIHFSFLHLEFGIYPQTLATLVLPCFIIMFFFFKKTLNPFLNIWLCVTF